MRGRYKEWKYLCSWGKGRIVPELVVSEWAKIKDKLICIQKVMEGLWKRNLKANVLHVVMMGSD